MTMLSILALIPISYFFIEAKVSDRFLLFGLGLVIGGALGNIHDRLRYNAVIDFLDFHVKNTHWPAFNIADIGICVGVFVIILRTIMDFGKKNDPKGAKRRKK
jgi:signal peptidase II